MKIRLGELKRIIKEVASVSQPTSFSEFRQAVGNAFQKHGAPEDLTAEVLDMDYEGGAVISALYGAWLDIQAELKRDFEWFETGINIYNAVVDAVNGYSNKMNYAPGHKSQVVDSHALATKVANDLTGEQETF